MRSSPEPPTFVVLASVLVIACGSNQPQRPLASIVTLAPVPRDFHESVSVPAIVREWGAAAMVGRWEGVGVQDGEQSWTMVVTIRSTQAGPCASAEYPTVPCSADWSCLEARENGELVAQETLTLGHDRCIDKGTMTLRLAPRDQLEWTWAGSGVTARAMLARVAEWSRSER